MKAKPIYYDGDGERKQTAGATKPSSVVITAEMRKSIGGNPFVYVK